MTNRDLPIARRRGHPVRGKSPEAQPEDENAASHRSFDFRQRDWALLLQHFSTCHEGRAATLEIDDPVLGSQVAVAGRRLLGIAYDWRAASVEIMLGEPGSTEHLTHTVSGVVGLEIQRGEGRDRALCIEDASNRTLLLLG